MGRVVMKKIILLLIGCLFFAVSAQAVYTVENTYEENGLVYDKETRQPITGKFELYGLIRDGRKDYQTYLYLYLYSISNYKDGLKHGIETKYDYDDGKVSSITPYTNGKKNGVQEQYNSLGRLSSKITYRDDIWMVYKKYDKNGVLYEEIHNKDGEEIFYDIKTNQPMAGVHQEFRDDGTLLNETPYKNGKKDGTVKYYFDNGVLFLEENYKNGQLNGVLKRYNENGTVKRERFYVDDLITGEKEFYENGKLKREETDSFTRVYREDGSLNYEILRKEGKKIEEWFYDEQGNKKRIDERMPWITLGVLG